jgi:hypothetical protein
MSDDIVFSINSKIDPDTLVAYVESLEAKLAIAIQGLKSGCYCENVKQLFVEKECECCEVLSEIEGK